MNDSARTDAASFLRRLAAAEPQRAVLLGDSITAGSQIDPHADPSIVFHQQWHDRLLAANPQVVLSRVNQGIPGNHVEDGLRRLQADALDYDPDLIIIAFGINDCWNGPAGLEPFTRGLHELATRASRGCDACVALMTTNMMNTRVTDEILAMAPFARQSYEAQKRGWTSAYMQRVRDVAASGEWPLIDGYARWMAYAEDGGDTDALLANGANHPNRDGHALLANAMWDVFGLENFRW